MNIKRRDLLLGAIGLRPPALGASTNGKRLEGVFPIAQTPFTDSNQLDLDSLVAQVALAARGGVHGVVWPQLASEWSTLTESERMAGMDALGAASRKSKPALVLGVQSTDVSLAVRFAQHAAKCGADAVIALPPSDNADPKACVEYYAAIARATPLPLFVQAVGKMSVELVLELHRSAPSIRFVKDEAGRTLDRIKPLREGSGDRLKVFSGNHGRTLIEELRRGGSGTMPAMAFADLYAATWDLWQRGRRRDAMAMHARTLFLMTEMTNFGFEAMKYLLCLRGVFRNYGVRRNGRLEANLDASAKRSLEEALEFARPYLRAAGAKRHS